MRDFLKPLHHRFVLQLGGGEGLGVRPAGLDGGGPCLAVGRPPPDCFGKQVPIIQSSFRYCPESPGQPR